MSVRRRKWRDPSTGASKEVWMIDVTVEHRDGRIERVRRVAPLQNRRAAEQYEHEVRASMLDGSFHEKKEVIEVPRFDDFAKTFLETYVKTNNKPSEEASKEMILRIHLTPAFGKLRLDAIGAEQIESYKARKIADGLSPKTVNNHLTVLRKLLDVAVEWRKLTMVPRVRWLRAPKPEFDFLTFDEAERLLSVAPPAWKPMITLGLRAGLRQGELLALRWDDVDLVAGRIVVRRAVARGKIGTPKNGRSREVPLSDAARAALREHRHLKGELVFSQEDGTLLTKGECKWPLWQSCKRAGLRRIGWHVLRHTFASHLVMRGVPLKAVQELLGHTTIEMTMRYAHLSPDVGRNAVQLLDGGHGTYAAHGASKAQNA
jgi:integrase